MIRRRSPLLSILRLNLHTVGTAYDAIVIGSGPNGLAAAITLASAGRSVLLREGATTIGGSTRSAELTLPGFTHDICSTVHAMACVSPFFLSMPLKEHNLELIVPPVAFAQPMDDGSAGIVERSVEMTAAGLGRDGPAYRRLVEPFLTDVRGTFADILGPARIPRHPLRMARFGLRAIRSARSLAQGTFRPRAHGAFYGGACSTRHRSTGMGGDFRLRPGAHSGCSCGRLAGRAVARKNSPMRSLLSFAHWVA